MTRRPNHACVGANPQFVVGDPGRSRGELLINWEPLHQSRRLAMLLARSWRAVSVPLSGGRGPAWKQTRNHAAAARMDLRGIYPPIATPFTPQEDVDFQKLEENLQKYAKIPFRGEF